MTIHLISVESLKFSGSSYLKTRIKVFHTYNWLEQLFFVKTNGPREYRGYGIVWHKYPGFKRASTGLEEWLCNQEAKKR